MKTTKTLSEMLNTKAANMPMVTPEMLAALAPANEENEALTRIRRHVREARQAAEEAYIRASAAIAICKEGGR